MEKKKTWTNVLLAIMGVLILIELVASVMTANVQGLRGICKAVSLAFIALYGLWFYKKPHGNMLKYAMLLLATAEIIGAAQCIQMGLTRFYSSVTWLLVAAVLVYVAGRLNRIEQNKYLLPLAAVVHFARTFFDVIMRGPDVPLMRIITFFSGAISIIILMIAYFVRYKEHKEAGLMDAPKK